MGEPIDGVADGRDAAEPSTAVLGPGSVLAERYRLVRRIGAGGMGSVWEAEHLALGSKVAIKLISPSLVHDERARARFLREAQAAANLSSPHVVQIFDHGVHEDTPYIAMELLEGEPLSTRLSRCGALPPDRVLELMTQIGRAAAKAHTAGVVHRDLKPDNIYLVAAERGEIAKVLDFGIAKRHAELALGSTTGDGAMLGTPFYMSPEQLVDAGLVDARADLWSLAVITYECLLGRRPFTAASMPELAVAVLAEPIPVPSTQGVVPPGFDAWFARAAEREPAARFQHATEMFDALAVCVQQGEGAVAVPVPSASRPATRSRSVLLLSATLLGAATLAAIAFAGDVDRPRRDAAPASSNDASVEVATPAAWRSTPDDASTTPASTTPTSGRPASTLPASTPTHGPTPAVAVDTPDPRKRTGKPPRKPSDTPSERPPKHDVRELEGL